MKNKTNHLKEFIRKTFGAIKAADLYENGKYIDLNWNEISSHYNRMEDILAECFSDYIAEHANAENMRFEFFRFAKICSNNRKTLANRITCP